MRAIVRAAGYSPAQAEGNSDLPAMTAKGEMLVATLAGADAALTAALARGLYATATWTPAASAYSANDVFSTAKALVFYDRAGVAFPGGEIMILSSVLQVAHTAVISGETSYLAALYNVTPPSAHADNDAWDVPSGDRAAYLGQLSLGTPVDLGSTLQVEVDAINRVVTVPAAGLFAELITVGGFTATAAARKLTLHAVAL